MFRTWNVPRKLTTLEIFMRTSNPQAPLVTYIFVTLYAFYWVYVAKFHCHAKLRHTGAKLRHTGAKLRHTGAKLRHTGAKLRHTGAKLRHTVLCGCDMSWRAMHSATRPLPTPHMHRSCLLPPRGEQLQFATTWRTISVHPRALLPVIVSLSDNATKSPSVSC
jgi:hypothetical protein